MRGPLSSQSLTSNSTTPYRYEGERFVMWSDAPEYDPAQMDAMDAHIRAMEEALGLPTDYKMYWVRGPVWGIEGRGGLGWALGSKLSNLDPASAPLGFLDRHESAHFVLDEMCPPGSQVPMLLHEGWAELHSTPKPESKWQECRSCQEEGKLPTLRELTCADCYYHSLPPMYSLGSVVVEYILKRFGHEKFLELCCTCREATFGEDVQRVLGLSLDELDAAYQQDLARRWPSLRESLLSARLADGIDVGRWRRLVEESCSAMQRLRSAFDHASVTVIDVNDDIDKGGKTKSIHYENYFEYHYDGERYANQRRFSDYSDVHVRTPEFAFGLKKGRSENAWQLNGYSARDRRDAVRMLRPPERPLFLWPSPLWWPSGPGLKITAVRWNDAANPLIRICFVKTTEGGGPWAKQQGWLDLDPRRDNGLVERKSDNIDERDVPTSSTDIKIGYEAIDGMQIPNNISWEMHMPSGISTTRKTTVKACRFAAPPASVFELATYGDFPLPAIPLEQSSFVPIAAWIAAGCTVLAILMLLAARFRSHPRHADTGNGETCRV